MILSKLKLDEETILEFSMEVFGTTESPSKIRLVIEGPEFDIACHCESTNDGIKVHVPKLKNIFPTGGIYEARLSVEVEGKIFTPLSEQIEFEPLIEVGAKAKKTEVKEGVKVTVKNMISEDSRSQTTTLEENLNKVIQEGYEVSQIGGNYIMKKGDAYVGLISQTAILKADNGGYATLTELVDGLSNG